MGMDISYEWQQYGSLRKGGQLSWSLMLTCTRWFKTEKIAFRLVDGSGQIPPKDGYVELEAGKSVRIDYDTYDWDWCDGDMIIIFDSKGREYDRQVLHMRTYAPGQCPECHGSHQCATCKGTGRVTDKLRMVSTCPRCLGTGLCQTCYVPTRRGMMAMADAGASVADGAHPNVGASRQRRVQALRSQIADLQEKINRCEFNEKMRTLHTSIHGYDPTMGTIDMAQANLKYKYQQLLMQAQQELAELEERY